MRDQAWTNVLFKGQRRILMGFGLVGSALLSACQGMPNGVPWTEIRSFTVPPESIQAVSQIRLRWLIRPDAPDYCLQQRHRTANAQRDAANGASKAELDSTRLLACAIWNEQAKECTIVTRPTTSHVIMGHEVHHCFSGHFHKM